MFYNIFPHVLHKQIVGNSLQENKNIYIYHNFQFTFSIMKLLINFYIILR